MLTLAVVKSLAIDYHWPQSMTLSTSVLWNHSYNLRRFCTLPIWSSFEYHFGKHKSESSILSCGQEMQQMRETCAIQVWAAVKKEQHCETTKSWVALNRWFNHFAWLIVAFFAKQCTTRPTSRISSMVCNMTVTGMVWLSWPDMRCRMETECPILHWLLMPVKPNRLRTFYETDLVLMCWCKVKGPPPSAQRPNSKVWTEPYMPCIIVSEVTIKIYKMEIEWNTLWLFNIAMGNGP